MLQSHHLLSTLFAACAILSNLARAELQTPACSLNCTLQVLESSGCDITNITSIRDCLCNSNFLQNELALCVFASCSQADQIVGSEVLQTQLCAGVPHESRSAEIIRVEIIIAAFAFPIVVLRLISRIVVARKIWWDDWMIVICAIFMVLNTSIPIYTAFIGFGEHIWNVPVLNITKLNLLFWIASIFYALIQSIAKFSILLLYLRIFPTPSFRLLVKLALAWQVCHMLAFTLTIIFQCIPVQSFWDLRLKHHCLSINANLKAGAFASIFEDLVIMVLPIGELKRLNLGVRKRVALCFMFALGSFACVTSMLRLKYVWNYRTTLDGTWDDIEIVLWSDIETYVAVICSCLMCIRPLLLKIFPALFPSTNSHSSNTKSSSKNSQRQPWGTRIGSGMKVTKTWTMEESGTQMTRLDSERGGESDESARTIIIQRNADASWGENGKGESQSQSSLKGIEAEERGESPGALWRALSEDGEARSVRGDKR